MCINLKTCLVIFVSICFKIEDSSTLSYVGKQDCNMVLQEFAISSAHFTLCAITHARPIKLCEMCATNYTEVQDAYQKILEMEDESGVSCKKKLINVDRLGIIENGFTYIKNLWQNAHCENCFEIVNDTVSNVLRNETKEFLKYFHQVNGCFPEHMNGSYNETVCKVCKQFYNDMNDVYDELKTLQGAENICVDIVDGVNTTRSKWSEMLRCDRKEMKLELGLVIALIAMSLLPLAFYTSTKHLTRLTETRLTQQKRLVQTFSENTLSTSR